MHFRRKYEACKSKTETLRDENVFFEFKVKTTSFYFFLQIYKLFFVTCRIFTVSKYRVHIIASDCILLISVIDDPNLYFNLKHHYLPWGRSAYLARGTSAHKPHHMANAVAKVSTFGKQFLAPLLLSTILLVIASAMFMSQ